MNTEYKSLYDILGVAANATPDEIHSAYKRLAKKYHPDINAGHEAGEMMRLLNGAHEKSVGGNVYYRSYDWNI